MPVYISFKIACWLILFTLTLFILLEGNIMTTREKWKKIHLPLILIGKPYGMFHTRPFWLWWWFWIEIQLYHIHWIMLLLPLLDHIFLNWKLLNSFPLDFQTSWPLQSCYILVIFIFLLKSEDIYDWCLYLVTYLCMCNSIFVPFSFMQFEITLYCMLL